MAYDSHQIREIKHCVEWWVNGWSMARHRQETTSENPELSALIPMLRKCGIPLSEDDIEFIADCVQTYFQIFRENYGGYPDSCMVGHSALLAYLLLGNQPFADPPPLRYAYPCYALAEGRRVYVRIEKTAYAEVDIDQATSWDWQERNLPPGASGLLQGILKHTPHGDLYQFEEATAEQGIDAYLRNLSPGQLAYLQANGLLHGAITPISGGIPESPCDTDPTITPETIKRLVEQRAKLIIQDKKRGILQGFLQRMDGAAPRRTAQEG